MRRKNSSKKLKPEWTKHFYVGSHDFNGTLILSIVRWRHNRKQVVGSGGFLDKPSAERWIAENWKSILDQAINDEILIDSKKPASVR